MHYLLFCVRFFRSSFRNCLQNSHSKNSCSKFLVVYKLVWQNVYILQLNSQSITLIIERKKPHCILQLINVFAIKSVAGSMLNSFQASQVFRWKMQAKRILAYSILFFCYIYFYVSETDYFIFLQYLKCTSTQLKFNV